MSRMDVQMEPFSPKLGRCPSISLGEKAGDGENIRVPKKRGV